MKHALAFCGGFLTGAYVLYRNIWKILYEPAEY